MRFWTGAFLIGLVLFFFIQTVALATESCPKMGSPEATAIRYQLFAAYQTGFDGYNTPCALKCFDKKTCRHTCQNKEALRLLQDKLQELVAKRNEAHCSTMTVSCVEQCKDLGASCRSACGDESPIAFR